MRHIHHPATVLGPQPVGTGQVIQRLVVRAKGQREVAVAKRLEPAVAAVFFGADSFDQIKAFVSRVN